MNLNQLLESYKNYSIDCTLDNYSETERAGILKFNDSIYSVLFIDDDNYVRSMQLISDALPSKNLSLNNMLTHTITLLNIINKTLMLITYLSDNEIKEILNSLGLFDGSFVKKKYVKYDIFMFEIETVDNLLILTVSISK